MDKNTPKVLPPANGKKLWRVTRTPSGTHTHRRQDSNSSVECLQNSLKIAAAGNHYTARKPPSRRPKTRPGMPTDFVFVDLSPVKTEDVESVSGSCSPIESPIVNSNDSMSSVCSEDGDSIFSGMEYTNATFGDNCDYVQDADAQISSFDQSINLGLGILNVDYNQEQLPMEPKQPQLQVPQMTPAQLHAAFQQFLQYQSQLQQLPVATETTQLPNSNKRSRSTSSIPTKKSKSGFQFKTYQGPKHKRSSSQPKPSLKHRHSEPAAPITPTSDKSMDLENLMDLNSQIQVFLDSTNESTENVDALTPASEFSGEELDFSKDVKLDYSFLGQNDYLNEKHEFDLDAFIAI